MQTMPIHLELPAWPQLRTVARCVGRVLADSERTEDIMLAEELTAQAQLRYLLRRGVLDSGEGRALMVERPVFADVDFERLATLPAHTLGGALARFHNANNLSKDLYAVPAAHTADADAAFLMERIRNSHDIWHVLTGLGVQGHEEILLHAFQLAQTGMPSSVALVLLGGVKHMVLEARWRTLLVGLAGSYRAGARAAPLLGVYWERHFETPVAELRQRYRIETLPQYA